MAASVPLAGFALLFLLLLQVGHGGGTAGLVGGASSDGYVPVRTVVYRPSSVAAAWTAEAYAPFQLCMGCRCCPPGAGAGKNDSSSCVDTSCCYGIDCNIPGKPFGTCGFTPRTCGCGGSNCTSAPAPPS